jgi:GNAT superfamily N-acetyltransferase
MAVTCAQTDADIQACWPVLVQLRPHLRDEDPLPIVRKQFAEGYRLAFVRLGAKVAGVAGYRILHNLGKGRHLYVDDLVTDEAARSRGVGTELMDWLCQLARTEGCAWLELDSGVHRFDAHRFYLRHRMFISNHHFSLKL